MMTTHKFPPSAWVEIEKANRELVKACMSEPPHDTVCSSTYLTKGAPTEMPNIWKSSERLLVVPRAMDVGVWSFVKIITILNGHQHQ